MAKLRSAAPIFQVADVGATLRWYHDHFGFEVFPFPKDPPHVFGILNRDGVEIMLQRVEDFATLDVYTRRPGGVWHAYLRVEDVHALYEHVKKRPQIERLEELRQQPYGDTEFVVKDPNGYVIVFSG